MILLLTVALAAAKPPPSAVVSSLQTSQLADACRGDDTDSTPNFCIGYIMGALDALSISHQICLSPAKASTLEAVGVARKYIRTHHDAWSRAPSFVVRDALKAEFPCTPTKDEKPKADKVDAAKKAAKSEKPKTSAKKPAVKAKPKARD